jgi:hypothetical protein
MTPLEDAQTFDTVAHGILELALPALGAWALSILKGYLKAKGLIQ